MTQWRFADPLWLTLAPIVIVVIVAAGRRGRAAVLYSSLELLQPTPVTLAQRAKRLLPWISGLGMLLLLGALARPQGGSDVLRLRSRAVAIFLCLDRSGSMQAMDFQLHGRPVTRLDAVKDVFRRFVAGGGGLPGRPHDLIGLAAFGGYAETKVPLTFDRDALLEVLESVAPAEPLIDSQGRVINQDRLDEELATAVGDAVALAVERIRGAETKSKVIILLSDGENNAGVVDPRDAARAAQALGIKLYTIGVGATGTAPFAVENAQGRKGFVWQNVRLDADTLRMMAHTTGGRYYNAKDASTLQRIYQDIDELEKTPTERRLYTQHREWYQWLALTGLGLVVLERILSYTRFRSLP